MGDCAPFGKYVDDLSPAQRKLITDDIARLRGHSKRRSRRSRPVDSTFDFLGHDDLVRMHVLPRQDPADKDR